MGQAYGVPSSGFCRVTGRRSRFKDRTPAVAEHHAALMAHVRRSGSPRGAHDLIIARATNRTLVTTDERARFGDPPGVDARPAQVKTR